MNEKKYITFEEAEKQSKDCLLYSQEPSTSKEHAQLQFSAFKSSIMWAKIAARIILGEQIEK